MKSAFNDGLGLLVFLLIDIEQIALVDFQYRDIEATRRTQ